MEINRRTDLGLLMEKVVEIQNGIFLMEFNMGNLNEAQGGPCLTFLVLSSKIKMEVFLWDLTWEIFSE